MSRTASSDGGEHHDAPFPVGADVFRTKENEYSRLKTFVQDVMFKKVRGTTFGENQQAVRDQHDRSRTCAHRLFPGGKPSPTSRRLANRGPDAIMVVMSQPTDEWIILASFENLPGSPPSDRPLSALDRVIVASMDAFRGRSGPRSSTSPAAPVRTVGWRDWISIASAPTRRARSDCTLISPRRRMARTFASGLAACGGGAAAPLSQAYRAK